MESLKIFRIGILSGAIAKLLVIITLALVGLAGFGVSACYADLLVCSGGQVRRYDDNTGALLGLSASGGGLIDAIGLGIGPDGNLYVSSSGTDQVLRYDGSSGSFIDIFASGGGLQTPAGLVFGPDGNLYVNSFNSDQVLRYNGSTGAFVDVFASGGGLTHPFDLDFGSDGNLYVSGTNGVFRYNGSTGAFVDVFVAAEGYASTGLVFGPDGNLYVGSNSTWQVRRYNGSTGAFVDVFTPSCLEPRGLAFGPDGNFYCSSNILHQVLRYDGSTGAFLDVFVPSVLVNPDGVGNPSLIMFTSTNTPPPEEFSISFTTFIASNSITGPPQSRCGSGEQLFFAGDDRGLDPTAGSFRTRQLVTVITEESVDVDGIKAGSDQNLVGETKAYAPDALPTIDASDDDGVLHDCHLLHDRDTASSSNMHINGSRIDAHTVSVHLFGSVGNPLINVPDRLKTIDWDFTLSLDTSGSRPHWALQGVDDGFPSFEIYINDSAIYTRNAPPPYTFQDLLKLLPGRGDVLVNLSGDLP